MSAKALHSMVLNRLSHVLEMSVCLWDRGNKHPLSQLQLLYDLYGLQKQILWNNKKSDPL